MDVKAIHRNARISPQKVREVTREIQGMDVSAALALLHFTPKKAALMLGRTLQSAIANASHNHGLETDNLYVKSATANKGLSFKRIMPRARGSAAPIIKRMAHITIVVAPKPETAVKEKPAAKSKARTSATARRRAAAPKSDDTSSAE